jgi:hypothetical protein
MTHAKRIWLFRFALPMASVLAAILWGATWKNALLALPITAFVFLLLAAIPSPLSGIFLAVFSIYGSSPQAFEKEADETFFLLLGIPATLLAVSIVAIRLG